MYKLQPWFIFTVLVLFFGHFFVDFMLGIWPLFKTMSKLDLAKAGMISAASSFIGEGSQLVFGSLSDRGYRRHLIALGIFLTGFSTLLAYTGNYFAYLVLFMSTMIGSGMFHPSAVGLLGQISDKRKALLIGFFISGGGLGMAFSQIIYVHTFHFFSGHMAFLALPSVFLAALVFFKSFHSPSIPKTDKPHSKRQDILNTFRLFKNRDLTTLYFSQLCNQTIFWGLVFLLPDVLTSREYDRWVCFGGGHLCLILGASIAMIPAGYLADRYSTRSVLIGSYSIGAVLLYSILYSPYLENTALLCALFVLGAVTGVVNPVSLALGNRLAPNNPGMVSAFLMGLVWCVAEGLGPGGGGLLTLLFEDDAPAKALSILGVTYFIGFILATKLPVVEHQQIVEAQKI